MRVVGLMLVKDVVKRLNWLRRRMEYFMKEMCMLMEMKDWKGVCLEN